MVLRLTSQCRKFFLERVAAPSIGVCQPFSCAVFQLQSAGCTAVVMASASSLGREYLSGSLASCTTAALFSPLECVKTRLQLQDMPGWRRIYTQGFLHALQQIYRQDGLLLLWSHGFAGLVGRDFFYSGMRTGMYPTVRGLIAPGRAPGDISLTEKIAAGAVTGGLGAGLANPFDVR